MKKTMSSVCGDDNSRQQKHFGKEERTKARLREGVRASEGERVTVYLIDQGSTTVLSGSSVVVRREALIINC